MGIEEYFAALENHDWFYMYSDDHKVFGSGGEKSKNLESISKQSKAHRDLYLCWCSYVNDVVAKKPRLSYFLDGTDEN